MALMVEEKRNTIQRPYLWLAIITLIGGAVRFYHLGGDSFWFEEILTLNTASAGFQAAFTVPDHPPLLYLLTSLSIDAFGVSEMTVRLISALAGTAGVALVGWWGIMIGREGAGLWAALLLACSPFHLRYSQEARHYALIMLFSLAMVVFLHLALTRGRWRWWIASSLATLLALYTNYGAILILPAAGIAILIWLLQRRSWRNLRYPLVATAIILAGYAPWLARFWTAFSSGGIDAQSGATDIAPLSIWLRNAYHDFGYYEHGLPALALLLFVAGLIIIIRQKDWLLLSLITLTIRLPFLLIWWLHIARYGFAKYIIYMLPLYLFTIAIVIDAGLALAGRKLPARKVYPTATAAGMILVAILLAPLLIDEYQYVERDWRGAVQSIASQIEAGDLFIPIALDLPDGFNQGRTVLPYYLDQIGAEYTILDGDQLRGVNQELLQQTGNVWLFALNRVIPMTVNDEGMRIQEFQGKLFLIAPERSTIYNQTGAAYRQLIPLTVAPGPRCMLAESLAQLYGWGEEWDPADSQLNQAAELCPDRHREQAELQYSIDKARLPYLLASGQEEEAVRVAHHLWQQDAKDEDILALLTVDDLLQQFKDGEARVMRSGAPEPVAMRRFTMPRNGDWGDVLFVHPPAAVDFQLTLPDAPANFHTRIAMAPESWDFGGDGSTFVVTVTLPDGSQHELLRQYVSNETADRDWQAINIPLDAFAGQAVTLTLSTEPGPNNDSTGDWAGFETPRITRRPQ